MSDGKGAQYKFFWIGNVQGTNGVGVFLAEDLIDKIYDIKCVSDRIVLIKLLICDEILTILSVYAPQTGLDNSINDSRYDSLLFVTSGLPDDEIVIPCGDWNGHVGKVSAGYEEVHGRHSYGTNLVC